METTETQESSQPRPAWQIWGARVAVVFFILLVIAQIVSLANGWL